MGFWKSAAQLVIPLVVALGIGYWSSTKRDVKETSSVAQLAAGVDFRETPLRFDPIMAESPVLSPADAHQVLHRMLPGWSSEKSGYVNHAMRLWAAVERWRSPESYQDAFVAAMFQRMHDEWIPFTLDTRVFQEKAPGNPSIFSRTPYGVRVRTGNLAYTSPYHVEQMLQVLAEIDLTAEEQIVLEGGETAQVGDLVTDAMRRFTDAQELQFTTTAFTMWLPPRRTWMTRFGQRVTFDEVAQQLVSRPLGRGACAGAHVPFALVHLLRAHEVEPILSDATYNSVRYRLTEISRILEKTQLAAGTWDRQWHDESRAPAKSAKLGDVVVVTGHQLEWIAFAPLELRPRRRTVERAASSLAELVTEKCSPNFIVNSHPIFTHAARALYLLSLKDGDGSHSGQPASTATGTDTARATGPIP